MVSKRELYPRVEDLYNGRSVFITGAGGFVGMVIMETLLRTCPGIESIYILLRPKKGVQPQQRMEKLFEKKLFDQLKKECPGILDKVRLVSGDVSLPDLGMSEEHVAEIIENVSIVFHCAADLRFVKPIKYLMGVNTMGTYFVVELCKKLKNKIEALVFTSTICSNCNRKEEIEEQVYRLPYPSQKFLQEFKDGTDESLEKLVSTCHPHWPNGYTFNKCLAENILLENASEVPSAIIRPSLVSTTWKGPLPGFFERNSTLSLLAVGTGQGFVKVLLVDPENNIDLVPADVVANSHIVAAWKVATGRSRAPFIVNCSSYGMIESTYGDFIKKTLTLLKEYPLPNCFRTATTVKLTTSQTMYRIFSFYEHYVPAYVIDLILKLTGNTKLRLVSLYDLFDKAMITAQFFTISKGKYITANFRSLEQDLEEDDKKKFYTDISELSLQQVIDDWPRFNEVFDWTKDKLTKAQRMRKADQRHYFSQFIKYSFLLIVFTLIYLGSSKTCKLLSML